MTEQQPPSGQSLIIHATCVDAKGSGILIIGGAGSGKSALALQLMAFGACLVADDRTVVTREGDGLVASAPKAIQGLIEARGIGILNAMPLSSSHIRLVVDMDRFEERRLPLPRLHSVAGVEIPCLRKVDAVHFSAAIWQYIKAGKRDV